MSRLGECDFCFRGAVMTLTSYRHPLWRRTLGLRRRTCRTCQRCAPRAIRWLALGGPLRAGAAGPRRSGRA